MIHVRKFKEKDTLIWNAFVASAKNATFLFNRSYMDYHKDRFKDFSLMVEVDGKIVAVLPANITDTIVTSHAGLTYGGFVLSPKTSVEKNIAYIKAILEFLEQQGVSSLQLKMLPDFFSKCSQSEIEYVLFLIGAHHYRIDTALVLDYRNSYKRKMPKGRKSEITKARRFNPVVEESETFTEFWEEVLSPNLKERFNVKPVHSLEEITLLKANNPKHIKQFNVRIDNVIVAGATVFETETTAHLQYLAGNNKARETGGLDYLFYELIKLYDTKKTFFDFGIVNEDSGKKVNRGMLKWKESYGTRIELHKFYKIDPATHNKLEVTKYAAK